LAKPNSRSTSSAIVQWCGRAFLRRRRGSSSDTGHEPEQQWVKRPRLGHALSSSYADRSASRETRRPIALLTCGSQLGPAPAVAV
jgi:hypothetical protein